MAEIHILERNNEKLVHYGYIYNRDRVRCGITTWKCQQQGVCNGRVNTTYANGELEVELTKEHNHGPQHEEVARIRIRTNLKRKARENLQMSPLYLVDQEIMNAPPGLSFSYNEKEFLCRIVTRSRESKCPSEVISAADIEISDWLFKTISGQQFLLHDNIIRNEVDHTTQRTIIFATDENLRHLFTSSIWYADATFHIVPTLFCQLWTIHGKVKEAVLPLVYVLMQSKKEEEYFEILMRLRQRAMQLNTFHQAPSRIMVDYNKGAVNAMRAVFPQAIVNMCLFHYKQSLWRKIQDFCLQAEHGREGSAVKKMLWSAIGLAYVPPKDVVEVFDLFLKHFESTEGEHKEKIKNFGEHLARNYVLGQATKELHWRTPRYPIDMWSVYERTLTEEVRIDSVIEEWQTRYGKTIHHCKYAVHSVVGAIREEQNSTECALAKACTGHLVQEVVDKRTLQMNEEIRQFVMRYQEFKSTSNVLEYIAAAGSYSIL